MLFVDPPRIGRGVGRALYRPVLAEAGRLGFTRVSIAADPHAEPFYLTMGAQRADSAVRAPADGGRLVGMEARPAGVRTGPVPSWVRAWTDGRRTVPLGNVA